jgi:AraC-like DNA-binding protein
LRQDRKQPIALLSYLCCVSSGIIVKILYSAASLQGLFLGFLLFRTKNNQPANRVLSVLLLLISFHLILVGFDERSFFISFPHLSRISWIIGTLYWPLLFLFIQKTTRYNLAAWKNGMLFLPFLFFLAMMIPYYLQSAEAKRIILDDFEKASLADFGWINQAISLLHLLFQGLALRFYYHIENKVKEEYSGDETIRLKWLKEFLIGIFTVTVIAVLSFFARNFQIPVLSELYRFHFFGLVILFYWLSYKALTYPVVFGLQPHSTIDDLEPQTPSAHENSPSEKLQKTYEAIQNVLQQERLFLNSTLTLTELASKAGVNRSLASEAINSQSGGNFFDLVNGLRVAEFKRQVKDPTKKNLSILGIAQESGFNSKATFYSTFKKITGKTPSEFLETEV